MKEVKAYIKAFKLHDVTHALHKIDGLDGASVSEVRGFGRSKKVTSGFGSEKSPSEFVKHVKIEVVCEDDVEEQVVNAIHKAAHTGLRGDGKIYVSDVNRSIRIEEPGT
jgi:nitrogen regulatory protein PII